MHSGLLFKSLKNTSLILSFKTLSLYRYPGTYLITLQLFNYFRSQHDKCRNICNSKWHHYLWDTFAQHQPAVLFAMGGWVTLAQLLIEATKDLPQSSSHGEQSSFRNPDDRHDSMSGTNTSTFFSLLFCGNRTFSGCLYHPY